VKVACFLFFFPDCRLQGSDASGANTLFFLLANNFAFSGLSELVGFVFLHLLARDILYIFVSLKNSFSFIFLWRQCNLPHGNVGRGLFDVEKGPNCRFIEYIEIIIIIIPFSVFLFCLKKCLSWSGGKVRAVREIFLGARL